MFKSFLNEIKNTVVSNAASQLQGAFNRQFGGSVNFNLPKGRGGIRMSTGAVTPDPFANETVIYPEDLGSNSQGHYVLFNINEQTNANVSFGQKGISDSINKSIFGDPALAAEQSQIPISNNNDLGLDGAKDQFFNSGQSTVSVKRAATRRLKSAIAMYMPSQVSVGQASQYGEIEIGAFTAAGINAYNSLKNSPNVFDNPGEFFTKAAQTGADAIKAAKNSQGAESFVETSVRGSLEMIPGLSGMGAAHDIQRGFVRNNRVEMVFEGIGRRTFSFSFKMMPKSEKEAIDVDKIVRMFRFYMAPSFMGNVSQSRTMIVPSTFDISYLYSHGNRNNFLNKISTCVLESCNVTYGGERVQFYRPTSNGMHGDGAPPVETQIDLQFKELEIITRERIGVGY